MAPPAGAPRRADGPQLRIDLGDRPCGPGVAQPLEHAYQVLSFTLAEAIGASGVVRHGIANDVALRLSQAGGGLSNLRHGSLIERKRHPCHNEVILP
jgi:hypothetical protein